MKQDGDQIERVYNVSLLFAFLANVFLLISVSLLFRYADFVSDIGGSEWHLGWIVGTSSVGAIVFRLWLGTAIDRIGPQWIWYGCLVGQITSLYLHLYIDSPATINVYLVRFFYATCVAGTFGCWVSFVSLQAPENRVAEVLGVVGASGFVGMAIGPMIGDFVFQTMASHSESVRAMFLSSIGAVCVSLLMTVAACRSGEFKTRRNSKRVKNPLAVISQARPGFVLVLGVLMGITIGFPGTYLRPMAASMGIEHIKVFFISYNLTAFVSRLVFRQAPTWLGLTKTIFLGFGIMSISMLLYLLVDSEFALIWPALVGGLAHSFLFPSVIALCTEKFAKEDRGVAANLILAMYDTGILVGMPTIGVTLTLAERAGMPAYSTVLSVLAATIVLVLMAFRAHKSVDGKT